MSDEVGFATPKPDVLHRGLNVVDFESLGVVCAMTAKLRARRGVTQSQQIGNSWAKWVPLEFVVRVERTGGLKRETNRFEMGPPQELDRRSISDQSSFGKLHSQLADFHRQTSLLWI